MSYTELQITTNFTFLRGGSHPEEIVEQALAIGHTEIAITDHNTLAGIVRAYTAAKNKNIPCSFIVDNGLTEFGGEKTPTAVAIGPAQDEIVDQISGKLQLL
jgi:DNA polymerase III alpha subunit